MQTVAGNAIRLDTLDYQVATDPTVRGLDSRIVELGAGPGMIGGPNCLPHRLLPPCTSSNPPRY